MMVVYGHPANLMPMQTNAAFVTQAVLFEVATLLVVVCARGTESHAPRAPDFVGNHFVGTGRHSRTARCAVCSPILRNTLSRNGGCAVANHLTVPLN